MIRCAYCGKVLFEKAPNFNEWCEIYTNYSLNRMRDYFCNEEHWLEYWKPYFIEEYNGANIYKLPVNKNGELAEIYVPYIGCAYGYPDLESCRARINNKKVAVMDLEMFKFMWNQQK